MFRVGGGGGVGALACLTPLVLSHEQLLTKADGIHSTFVTAVSFVPLPKAKVEQQKSHTLALVSVSADRSFHVMLPRMTKGGFMQTK